MRVRHTTRVKALIPQAIAALLLSGALLGCEHHPARAAPGFKRSNLARLRVGLPIEAILQVLGSPLERYPKDPQAIDAVYVYATHNEWTTTGGGWHVYSTNGTTCSVTVSGGAMAEVFVSTGHASCMCTDTACPDTWLDSCASGIPE
jgi:hypothetical protein